MYSMYLQDRMYGTVRYCTYRMTTWDCSGPGLLRIERGFHRDLGYHAFPGFGARTQIQLSDNPDKTKDGDPPQG